MVSCVSTTENGDMKRVYRSLPPPSLVNAKDRTFKKIEISLMLLILSFELPCTMEGVNHGPQGLGVCVSNDQR